MRAGVLFVSRHTKLLPWYKTLLEEAGYRDVHVTDKDKDGLNMLINELNPRRIFITSNFYSIGTPYMVGLLHDMFPRKNITVASMEEFPDEMAVWFIFHGAGSYVNFLDGFEEFKNGLKHILYGEDYIAPAVKEVIDGIDEFPDCKLKVEKRQKEILFMLCNGYTKKKMQNELQISEYTVHYHLKELMSIFHVHSREDLIKVAFCLDIITKKQLRFHENRDLIASLPEWARAQITMNRRLVNDCKN
ncbi:MAG: LuxR C-terminal-related transcriptional regulator [Treponema sp.]|nr:LuxR C-terminal-related transcriptional regulator [Treponema sp.]